MNRPRVKICCIGSVAEARLAVAYGAAALGLVGPMPSGPGVIDDVLIRQIAQQVPPPVATFLLTSQTTASEVIAHHGRTHTSIIQLVDELAPPEYAPLRQALPQVKLVQVVHVLDERSVEAALAVAPQVDALLLDSGNPNLAVKELGGTGRTHNWQLSRRIRDSVGIPLFLAGGLTPQNVRQAIDQVQPFGLDLCSGVRTNGHLDERKLEAFFRAIG
ncbi:MAG: phosphoribosylanthranilate isomerase [Bernardetiaceae bacterium]|jgi:phosphoribosylanthranilate isomerase|nr:phosphoribosylanthranilate isomerase [Bernardetiaceae bacterium]